MTVRVVSSSRPLNVAKMQRAVGDLAVVWYVEEWEAGEYRRAGAEVREVERPYPANRNAALDDAFDAGETAIVTDDDLTGCYRLVVDGDKKLAEPVEFGEMISEIEEHLGTARLGGVAPTPNAFYARDRVLDFGFVSAKLNVVLPSSPRYDETLRLKADYDFTLQHVEAYGAVARCDWLLPRYGSVTNRGGCQQYRSDDLARECAATLAARWPDSVVWPHPRRGDREILLRR